jgi:negative regulator of sigma E activity
MPCEPYKIALIEAVDSGLEPKGELRAHLTACAACRISFAQEHALFSSIDAGLHVAANAEVPASLLPRVRARLADEPAPHRDWRISSFVLAGATAVIVAILVVRAPWRTSVGQPPSTTLSNSASSVTVKPPQQNQDPLPASPVIRDSISHSRAATTRIPVSPESASKRDAMPEVLVPRDQELLLATYAEQWTQRKRAPLVAANFDATSLSPLQITPIQIAQLDVKLMAEEQAQ